MRRRVVLKNAALSLALWACVPATPWACAPAPPIVGTSGQLGNGTFVYVTQGNDTAGSGEMPAAIAIGAVFGLSFQSNDRAAQTVTPVSSRMLVPRSGGTFNAAVPGQTALLAATGNTVLDLIHVRLANIDHFLLSDPDRPGQTDGGFTFDAGLSDSTDGGSEMADAGSPSPRLLMDHASFVAAQPLDKRGVVLAGSLTYVWESSAPDVVIIRGAGAAIHLAPMGAGTANISVAAGGARTVFPVTVTEVAQ